MNVPVRNTRVEITGKFAGNENTSNLTRNQRQTGNAAVALSEEIVADVVALTGADPPKKKLIQIQKVHQLES